MSRAAFPTMFEALTGYQPFHWQTRLYEVLTQNAPGRWPTVVDLPTGLGKTHVITTWLCALTTTLEAGENLPFPRRLIYIVNRRTVVDQSTSLVTSLVQRLTDPQNEQWEEHASILKLIAAPLRACAATSGTDTPLAVSTLRGELADNGAWKRDPTKPAVAVGTVDMIGSKLLFSGYGDSHRTRPLHAGLVGQDALFVHDEAHLTRPFGATLRSIAKHQLAEGDPRPIRVMELSATPVEAESDPSRIFQLKLEDEPVDQQKAEAERRLTAAKRLRLHPLAQHQNDQPIRRLVELAQAHEGSGERVLLFVQSPEDAKKLRGQLSKAISPERIAVLTGTLRGKERDELISATGGDAETKVLRRFLGEAEASELPQTTYLISTSAGEVGADFDADHLVCDLTVMDSMVQRLGRVNRRGRRSAGNPSQIDVVVEHWQAQPPDSTVSGPRGWSADRIRQCRATFQALGSLEQDDFGHKVSPLALRPLTQHRDAWSTEPAYPPLTDILLDSWSLTTAHRLEESDFPPKIAPWLHGIEDELPQTHIAWRWDIAHLHKAEADESGAGLLNNVMQRFRLLSHEQLRDRTDRVRDGLKKAVRRLEKQRANDGEAASPDHLFAGIRSGAGQWRWTTLRALATRANLEYATVVLPVEVGGVDAGLLDGQADPPDDPQSLDVAEWRCANDSPEPTRCRLLWKASDLDDLSAESESTRVDRRLRRVLRVTLTDPELAEDGAGRYLDYLLPRRDPDAITGDDVEAGQAGQTLEDHTQAVTSAVQQIARCFSLDQDTSHALSRAARWHDAGKAIELWQRIGCNNTDLSNPLAKPPQDWYFNGRWLQGYRHEFGSIVAAAASDEIQALPGPQKDLVLHLIAAHHGFGRPHFQTNAGHPELEMHASLETQAAEREETMRRFGRLQQRYGRWGLAWLETLLRCADALGSDPANTSTAQCQWEEVPK
jgi:CRISPR-associated endonuclease/helicase Cas3